MAEYFAFLRGINVSGQKLIKMTDLAKIFTDAGFNNVKTIIQSGNVVFDSAEKNVNAVEIKLEKVLAESLGYPVVVFMRTFEEIRQIVDMQPFVVFDKNSDVKKYVTFTKQQLPVSIKLPFLSPAGDVELIMTSGNTIFSLTYPAKEGRSGFPNSFIEKEFKIQATTRNWNTVCKMLIIG
jgi:uncharacterized protein (DUF1697 family)